MTRRDMEEGVNTILWDTFLIVYERPSNKTAREALESMQLVNLMKSYHSFT